MNKRDVAVLAFKLMAVYVAFGAVSAAQSVFNNWYAFPSGSKLSLVSPFLLSAGISLAMGLLLWMSAEGIARAVYRGAPSTNGSTTGSQAGSDVMQLAVGIIGLWVVINAGPSLLQWIALYLFSLSGGYESVMGGSATAFSARPQEVFNVQAQVNILTTLAELIIGIVLVVMPRRVVTVIDGLKAKVAAMHAGQKVDKDDEPEAEGEQ